MLEFIAGRAGSGKTAECLQSVAEKIKHEPLGRPLLILTPAHLTYKLECRLAGLLTENGSGFIRAQVYSFQRLAVQVLQEAGGAVYPRITSIGKRLLLKKVLAGREKDMTAFSRAVKQRGFVSSVEKSIEEFKSYNISLEKLKEAAGRLTDEGLKNKINDLAVLYDDFSRQMAGKYSDAEDILDKLIRKIPEARFLQGAEIWVDGFANFNPQEMGILSALLKVAADVHVTLLLDPENDRLNSAETGIFHNGWRMLTALQREAQELGVKTAMRWLTGRRRFRAEGIAAVERELFSNLPRRAESGAGVRIVEAGNRRREMEAVAADILRLCREKNFRWRDIGILLRNAEDYNMMPELVLEAYDIPFFCDFKRAGVHHPLAELIRSAFDVLNRWQYESVFRALRTGFFPLTRDQIDILENYVLRFGIRDSRFTQDEDWKWVKRYNELEIDKTEPDESELAELQMINMLRHRVTEPLLQFTKQFGQAENVAEQTQAVYDFLVSIDVPTQLEQMGAQAENDGRLDDSRLHRQLWDDIIELMEQFTVISGKEKMSRREYAEVFCEGLDALVVAIIPPGLDYVTLSSFDRNSLMEVKALYIVGANEGAMPRRCQEKGLLSDVDRLRLSELDIDLPAGARNESFGEPCKLYRGFCGASEYLWISYPLADGEGNGLKESLYITRMKNKIFSPEKVESVTFEIEKDESGMKELAGARQSCSQLAAVLRRFRENPQPMGFWQDVYNTLLTSRDEGNILQIIRNGLFVTAMNEGLPKELAEQLYVDRCRLKGSVSKFESFQRCPFSYFLKYGLKLKERDEYKFEANNHGTFLHAVMADFGMELKRQQKSWSEVTAGECETLCREIVDKLAPRMMNEIFYSSEQRKNLLQRIEATAENSLRRLIEFDKTTEFSPALFEQSFGMGKEAMAPLRLRLTDELVLEVTGKIDRIDKTPDGRYFLVMDYKTGNMSINLKEVYDGVKLQLLTYLILVKSMSGADEMPAGMLYCFLKQAMIKSDEALDKAALDSKVEKEMAMPGWLLSTPEVLKLVNGAERFLKLRINKDGSLRKGDKNGKTAEDFEILLKYTEWLLYDTGRRIIDGEIKVAPYGGQKSSCKYCPYLAVCGFDKSVEGFMERKPNELRNDEMMQMMAEKGGRQHGTMDR